MFSSFELMIEAVPLPIRSLNSFGVMLILQKSKLDSKKNVDAGSEKTRTLRFMIEQ